MPSLRSGAIAAAFTISLAVFAPFPAGAAFTFTNIADTSLTAPGGGTFSNFSVYSRIADAGAVYLQAGTSGGPSQALYRYDKGALSRVAAVGDSAPGGGAFTAVDIPSINGAGDLAFRGSTSLFGLSNPSIYAYNGNAVRRVVSYNGFVPGSNVAFFNNFSVPTLSADGAIAFTGGANDFQQAGIFRADATGPVRLISNGSAAPGGGTFSFSGFSPIPNQNASGKIVFSTGTSGGPTSAAYSYENGTTKRLAARNDPAPGGGTFQSIIATGVADDGRAFLWGTASDAGAFRYGVWTSDNNGALSQLVATGDSAPGGGTITGFQPQKNSGSGDFAFWGYAGGKESVFAYEQSSLLRIIGAGDALFGSTVTTLSVSIGAGNRNASPTINNAGQTAFYYELADGRKGVAVAQRGVAALAPEPGSLWLCLVCVSVFSGLTVRRAVFKA